MFAVSELYTMADRINLQVEVHDLIEALNEAGASCCCIGPNASVFALALLRTARYIGCAGQVRRELSPMGTRSDLIHFEFSPNSPRSPGLSTLY